MNISTHLRYRKSARLIPPAEASTQTEKLFPISPLGVNRNSPRDLRRLSQTWKLFPRYYEESRKKTGSIHDFSLRKNPMQEQENVLRYFSGH